MYNYYYNKKHCVLQEVQIKSSACVQYFFTLSIMVLVIFSNFQRIIYYYKITILYYNT